MEFPILNRSNAPLSFVPINISTDCLRHKNDVHFHDYTQICYMLSGTLKHTINGKQYLQTHGTCAFIFPYTRHQIDTRDSDDTPIAVFIRLYDKFMIDRGYRFFSNSAKYAHFEEYSLPVFRAFKGEERKLADEYIRSMRREFLLNEEMSLDRIAEIFADFLRMYRTAPVDEEFCVTKEQIAAINESIKYISDHLSEKLTIDTLCQIAAMSRAVYTKMFKIITGMSVNKLILFTRLYEAQTYIRFSSKSFDEIAQAVGLYDKSYLHKTFTNHFGISPAKARDIAKGDTKLMEEHLTTLRTWKWLDNINNSDDKK